MNKKYYKYKDDVLNRKISVCDSVYKAVKRFDNDLKRQTKKDFEYFYDEKKVDNIINFIESLKFSEQEYLDKNFILDNWQSFIIANIFGWYHKEKKTRRFKKAFIFVARGNGKSPLAAAIALVNLLQENGAQIYSISTNYQQSAIIYNYLKNFVLKDDFLSSFIKIYAHSIVNESKFSVYRPLSSKFKGFDGFNPSIVIADEVSAMQDYSLLNMFTTAMHKRADSLLFMITTANYINENAPGRVEYEYSKNILNNVIKDDNYFCILYEIDKHDNVENTKCYVKANPASFVKLDLLEKQYTEAKNKKELYNSFLTKNLNMWVLGNKNEFIDFNVIQECEKNYFRYKEYLNKDILSNSFCSVGADFSDRQDLTSVTFAFYIDKINKIYLKHFIFTTNTSLITRTETIRNLYTQFIASRDLIMCEGNFIDREFVLHIVLDFMKEYNLIKKVDLYFDEWGSIDYINILKEFVDNCVVVRQNLLNISEYTKNYQEFLVNKQLIDNNKCALWQLSNARVYTNNNFIKLQKETKNTELKIDTCLSSLMSIIGVTGYINKTKKQNIMDNTQPQQETDIITIFKSLYL
ncbi:MAG: terminase large subunit [Candidatus Woesearchaeota archaeon]